MDEILRFSGAAERDPAIDAWFARQRPELGVIAREWFDRWRNCGDGDVRELMHDGCPTACVEDAALGYVNVFRTHVNVGFFHGADLPDPLGLLEGRGRRMRHIKLRPDVEVDVPAVQNLVDAAYAHLRACLAPWRP